MLQKIWEYIKHSVNVAWKSVFFNFKQYACFFLSVVIVIMLYGMVAVSADNGNSAEYKHIKEEYDYHIVLKGLNDDQARHIINYGSSPFKSDQFYDVVKYEKYYHAITSEAFYDVFLFFTGDDPDDAHERFESTYQKQIAKMAEKGTSFSKSVSPLMTYSKTAAKNSSSFFFISLGLLALCVFLLTSLYRIRINHYKFEYGIYLTYGADFKMLFSTAFWELFIIFIVCFIPAMALSAGLSYLIYSGTGDGFIFTFGAVIKTFIFGLVTITASVWGPMRIMSLRQPMSLIISEDNSNLVSSPWSSVSIFGEKFPRRYEFYSLWRFRKYNIQVLTTAIVFCALFIMGLYSSVIYKTNISYPRPQFTVSLSDTGYVYDEYMNEELYSIDGVRAVEVNDNSTEAVDISSHILVKKSDTVPLTFPMAYNGKEESGGDALCVTNNVLFKPISDEQVGLLEYYDYTGDLSCYQKDGYVIVSDSESNMRKFKFEVGDKIKIAVKVGQYRTLDSNETGRILLQSQLKFFKYQYKEYTVGAVIHNIPCTSTPIWLPIDDYTDITGLSSDAKIISVYSEEDLTPDEMKTLYSDVRAWAHEYGDIIVTDNDTSLNLSVSNDRHYKELFIVISLMILLISPLVWFFSQTLYYSKREKEFNILQSLGAVASEIRSICVQGGLTMAALSLVTSIALSYLGSLLLYLFFNVIVPKLHGEVIRYSFYMPWYAIVTSIVVSVVCGFLATYLPFRSYYKHHYSLQNGGAGEEYGADE